MPKKDPIYLGPVSTVAELKSAVEQALSWLSDKLSQSSRRTETLDLNGNKIINVADASNAGDVVNLRTLQNSIPKTTTSTSPQVYPQVQFANATGALTLTNAAQDVPGATLTLARSGRYLIHGVFDFTESGAGDVNVTFIGTLMANGITQTGDALFVSTAAAARATVVQQWYYVGSINQVVKLQASKTSGTGTSVANITHTTISAIWLGP